MKTDKQLLITFDYELFLGNRSGSVEECMIRPTNDLVKVMGKYGVKAVFFVDTTCLLRMKEQSDSSPACAQSFNLVAEQLRDLVTNGHYVYPHIHPHWLDAEYLPETNQWRLKNTARYRFHNITATDREKLFTGSVNLLREILQPVSMPVTIDGYRAGGWCIQPFEDFYPLFVQHGIRHEFSVMKGFYQFTDAQYFDFTIAPEKDIYYFEEDVCRESPKGRFTQYSISSLPISAFTSAVDRLILKLRYRFLNDHTFHKGEGQPSFEIPGINPAGTNGRNLSDSHWERVSVELLTAVKLDSYLKFMDQNKYMHFISHPKMITRHNLGVFDKFLKVVFDKYSVETDFKKMSPR